MQERIDQFYACSNWLQQTYNAKVFHLDPYVSDHIPTSRYLFQAESFPKPFRFKILS